MLITGGDSLEAQAAVKLAVWAGAAGVFVLNAGNVLSKRIHGGHVAVLAEDPKVWLPVVQGDMDVVIDFEYPKNFQSVIASMTRKGRLVCKYPDRDGRYQQSPSPVSKFLGQSALCAMSRASIFDFDEYIRTNLEDVKVSSIVCALIKNFMSSLLTMVLTFAERYSFSVSPARETKNPP